MISRSRDSSFGSKQCARPRSNMCRCSPSVPCSVLSRGTTLKRSTTVSSVAKASATKSSHTHQSLFGYRTKSHTTRHQKGPEVFAGTEPKNEMEKYGGIGRRSRTGSSPGKNVGLQSPGASGSSSRDPVRRVTRTAERLAFGAVGRVAPQGSSGACREGRGESVSTDGSSCARSEVGRGRRIATKSATLKTHWQ